MTVTLKQQANCLLFSLAFLLFMNSQSLAQISQGGSPLGFDAKELIDESIPNQSFRATAHDVLERRSAQEEAEGLPPRFGDPLPVDLNLQNAGTWTTMKNGDRVWRLQISSPGARSLNLLYDDFYLPEGAKFFVYGANNKSVLGAFTSLNNKVDRIFATGLIYDKSIVLEYYEPKKVQGQGSISVGTVVHGFKYIDLNRFDKAFNDSGACNVNVNCADGNDWQNEKKSVAMLLVNGFRFCTGYLVNNTAQDCRPLFMTANHCLGSIDAVNNPNASNWTFMWNYESPGCNNVDGPTNQTTVGATLIANPGNPGDVFQSDFGLFELTENPKTAGYEVFFAGFDANAITPTAVGIHHPAGDIKKISYENQVTTFSNYLQVDNGTTHVRVEDWDSGTTEGGSSGSPLFDQTTKRTIGCLSGGFASCSSQTADWYGATSHGWTNNNASNAARRLNVHLDPVGNGSNLSVDGAVDPCGNNEPTCTDGIQNGDETGVDCGGPDCPDCPTCDDNIQNGDETGVDCGGSDCPACPPTCDDGIQNGDETGVDCGGPDCPACPVCSTVTLTLNFDDYPEETSWEITDASGATVASGGTYPNQADGSTLVISECLEDGCYDLTIFDSFGDGLCCQYGDGSYSLTDADGNILASGDVFTSSETTNFCVMGDTPPTCNDGIQNGNETGVDCGGPDCDPCNTGCQEVIFNSNNFEAGWGIWNDGGNDCRRNARDANFANSGRFCVRLRDNTTPSSMTTDVLNFSSVETVTIDFSYITVSMDNSNEDFWLQMDTGNGFTTVEEWNLNDEFQNNVRSTGTATIQGPFSNTTRFRIRCDASGNQDWVYIDDVVITICENPAEAANGKDLETEVAQGVESKVQELRVFPNPSTSFVNIAIPQGFDSATLMINDLSGKVIYNQKIDQELQGQQMQLDLGNPTPGIYLVQLYTDKEKFVQKLVIQ